MNQPGEWETAQISKILGQSTLILGFQGATDDEKLQEAIDRRAPEMLPPLNELLQMMLGAELFHAPPLTLPETPALILPLFEAPVVQFGMLALAAEGPLRMCGNLGVTISDDPAIREPFNQMRANLYAIAGLALRGIIDGEKRGWWKAAPSYTAHEGGFEE